MCERKQRDEALALWRSLFYGLWLKTGMFRILFFSCNDEYVSLLYSLMVLMMYVDSFLLAPILAPFKLARLDSIPFNRTLFRVCGVHLLTPNYYLSF